MSSKIARFAACLMLAGVLLLAGQVSAGDWPMWRYDAQRRGVSPDGLAEELRLHWVRELPAPQRAWRKQFDNADKLDFDVSYEPVVMGTTMFVASMVTDSLTAYDTRTGAERWRFHANAPMRLAPVAWEGRVYAGSDDGRLYCLDADSGRLLWSFAAAPRDRWLLGNERLINNWPMRGGPVIRDGVVYLTAGIWPFMGIFIYALDAQTGEELWANSGTGSMFNLHQHGGAYAFGGVAPQGCLAATDDMLLIPGGRTPPAAYDRATGKFVYFRQAHENVGKGAGGYGVWAQGGWFYNHGLMYALQDGAQFRAVDAAVVSDAHIVGLERTDEGLSLVGYAPEPDVQEVEIKDRLGRGAIREKYSLRELFRAELDVPVSKVHIQAGARVYASGPDGLVAAIDVPGEDRPARVTRLAEVEGEVWSMIAADERLFVVTEEGAVYCFGPGDATPLRHAPASAGLAAADDGWTARVAEMLQQGTPRDGYALVPGPGSGRLVEELVRQTNLHVVAVERDARRADGLRRRLNDAGVYGRRAAVVVGDPAGLELAPYFASVIATEDVAALGRVAADPGAAQAVLRALRPYGGMAWLPLTGGRARGFMEAVGQADLPGIRARQEGAFVVVSREGPLPGAGAWTHQYADAANSAFSPDSLARAPLALLWFGGPSNHNALPRHMNGPVPQVVGGRLFLLGRETLSARDVYTGRELWVNDLPGIGHPFTSLEHEEQWAAGRAVYFPNHPGANFIGSPYVSAADGVYVMYDNRCLRLDPASGERVAEFTLPAREEGGEEPAAWGHMLIWEDLLIAGADPQVFDDTPPGRTESWNATSSDRIVAMNRHSGQVLWEREAGHGFRHNAMIVAAGKVFVIDGLSEKAVELAQRRGIELEGEPRVMGLNARTGEVIWSASSETFGTWLSYSVEHDVLLQAGRHGARQPLPDEPRNRMVALRGATGEVLWERGQRYSGPIAIRHDTIITGRGEPAINLLTGDNVLRAHPLTGLEIPWSFIRTYGCGTQNVSEHLITFRSGAAGYYDLWRDGGTGNFGGIRAGCTNNVVAADGVLNAPDYTRSCTCSYQLQTSAAFVHDPGVEMWTYTGIKRGAGTLERAGVNFGAPGSRLAADDTWWLEYPPAGGSALELPVEVETLDAERWGTRVAGWTPDYFLHHSTWVQDEAEGLEWVAASGIEGAGIVTITLAAEEERPDRAPYTVRLHFVEPGAAGPGERPFAVTMQDRRVIDRLDIADEAGAARRALVREISGVPIGDELCIELIPAEVAQHPPVLCGIEIVREDGEAVGRTPGAVRWSAAPHPWLAAVGAMGERITEALREALSPLHTAVFG